MSRIGLQPIPVPSGVTVDVQEQTVLVKGPKGEASRTFPPVIKVTVENNEVQVQRVQDDAFGRSMHGTTRSLLAGMIQGVTEEYVRNLEISGVGYRAQVQGQKLTMSVGFSHPIEYEAPEGVIIAVTDNTRISVSGINKQVVGQVAAQIRSYCPAEPYKGKGIKYSDEQVRRKAGKTVA